MNHSVMRPFGVGLLLSVLVLCAAAPLSSASEIPAPEDLKHGSRGKADDGTVLVYDNVNGIFMVPTQKDTFWTGDKFYRYDNGVWTTSKAAKGPWALLAEQLVPKPARSRFAPLRKSATAGLPSGDEAVYDPTLRAYKVAGKRGVFLVDAMFYRYDTGLWLSSPKAEGPWRLATGKSVPGPLRKAVPLPKSGESVTLPTGEVVKYDSKARLFNVEGKPGVVLYDGTYYEKRDRTWFASPSASGGFEEIADDKMPPQVRGRYHGGPADGGSAKAGKEKKNTAKSGNKASPAKHNAATKAGSPTGNAIGTHKSAAAKSKNAKPDKAEKAEKKAEKAEKKTDKKQGQGAGKKNASNKSKSGQGGKNKAADMDDDYEDDDE